MASMLLTAHKVFFVQACVWIQSRGNHVKLVEIPPQYL